MAALALIAACLALAAPGREDFRARVEELYAAGSLPEALVAARDGLRATPDDPVLLRRACQLALALRVPEVARASADRLAERVRSEELATWRAESEVLSREAAELEAREREVEDATVRARAVAIAVVVALSLLVLVLLKGSRPPP
jgi:hypothetical protein